MSKEKLQSVFNKRKAKEENKAKNTKKSEIKDLTPFIERFTQEKLDEWKRDYGNRELIFLKVEDYLAVLRPPMADDLGDYLTAIGTNGMSKAVAMIVEQLWIEGDYQLIEDEDNFIAVFLQMNSILESKKAEFFRA
ncbi:hypothetical protein [Riemerella anatipestifer]|uniref:hypothetical protein n=1 Tax=Riemerella anatipestifer TaxID=34085 RepID=UPI0013724A20|nr:hypothetical protein [Riemerella anatipestifer]MBT0550247.1 hypothetical protein [Riemerella anatipestifer]MBT0556971.1 hypothetical protein [Riemerella anatipestifer]MBT0561007.1 hypothetical protein [Riemerella anatipestifer]NAV17322.1 hypothetical protein [Riemerella anatipestifer]